jgi:DNA modification methylase
MGSGSCGVACHRLKRKFIGIEMKAEHFKLAKERLDKLEMVDIVAPPPTRIFH